MTPKLIFLHIPKAAGTSFRAMVWNLSTPEERFWHGMHASPHIAEYSPELFADKRFIGGHKNIGYYPDDAPNLYCSLLREPVARVVSLFSYFTRPEGGADEHSFNLRNKQRKRWLKLGIDPTSIVRSIEQCQAFRSEIENNQCAYLSRGERTFEDALATVHSNNFLLGHSGDMQQLTDRLAELLHWPELKMVRGNVTRDGGHDGILEEPGAQELIRELCQEDQKLYDHVCHDHHGLLENMPSRLLLQRHLARAPVEQQGDFSHSAWSKVRLSAVDTLAIGPNHTVSLEVSLHNPSREFLDPSQGDGIYFAFKIINEDGEASGLNCIRTVLSDGVPPGTTHTQQIDIRVPNRYYALAQSIRVGMLVKREFWVEQFCLEHTVTLSLQKDTK